MNKKSFALTVVLAFVALFVFDFLWHSKLLCDLYKETAHLWRPPETMQEFFPIATLNQFLTALFLCFIYVCGHEGKGITEGLRFGAIIGLLMGVMQMGLYPYMPIPLVLALLWFLGGLLEGLVIGIVCSLVYKK